MHLAPIVLVVAQIVANVLAVVTRDFSWCVTPLMLAIAPRCVKVMALASGLLPAGWLGVGFLALVFSGVL